MCNEIYLKEKTTSGFEKSIVVLIPKKKRTPKCKESSTLNLTTYKSKIIIQIIYNRIDKLKNRKSG